jgi:hypothetical protein
VRVAEQQHQAEGEDEEAEAERLDRDERAPRDHHRAEHGGERKRVGGRAEARLHPVLEPPAREAAVPAEPENCRRERAHGHEAEADQLGA